MRRIAGMLAVAEAALADAAGGGATAGAVVKSFECPVIEQPASG